jgi:hypothetical protein
MYMLESFTLCYSFEMGIRQTNKMHQSIAHLRPPESTHSKDHSNRYFRCQTCQYSYYDPGHSLESTKSPIACYAARTLAPEYEDSTAGDASQ